MRHRAYRAILLAGALALCSAPPRTSHAAEAESDGGRPTSEDIEEIVVSAKRPDRALMDVPFSVVALSARELDGAGIETTFDLPALVPGLVFSSNTVLAQPTLRGVGSDLLTAGAEPGVATYVDEVYRARPVSSLVNFYDVERVEVIAGPQGTLFGRNATGGVIQVVNRRPGPSTEAEGTFLYGNYDEIRFTAAANAPLLDDGSVRLRVSGLGDWRGGFTENLLDGADLDDLDVGAGRLQTAVDLSDDFVLLLSGDYMRERDTRAVAQKLVPPLDASPAVALFGGIVPPEARQVLFDTTPSTDVEEWGLLARLDGRLGWADLVSLTAYRESRVAETLDLDGTQVPFLVNEPRETSLVFTQELRLASSHAGPLEWLAGLYYLHESATNRVALESPLLGFEDTTSARLTADSVAGFGDVSWRFSESLRATAGLRLSWDRRSEDFGEVMNGEEVAAFNEAADWTAPTPRVVLEWLPADSTLAYASIARGYKAGGFNSVVAQPFPFDPEFLWAYEIGWKASLVEESLQLRTAGFYYDWQDLQLLLVEPEIEPLFPIVVNAASASVLGLDLALDYAPLAGLHSSLGLTLLDARFDEFDAFDPNDPDSDPDRSGNRLPRAPAVSLHAGARYSLDLGGHGWLTSRVDYSYRSRAYYNPFEDPLVSQSAFGLLGFQVRWEDPSRRFFVKAFVRNATNKLWAQTKVRVDGQIGNVALWAAPRRFGMEVGIRL